MKLELSIRAARLKNVAGVFKGTSDPFAVVTKLSTTDSERPVVLGKTEVIKNNLSPDWVKVFLLDYELGTPLRVAINIFDEVRKGDNISMGSAVFEVGELLGARGNTLVKLLKKGGRLFATVRKSEGYGALHLKIKGESLKNTEFFGTSDPFFELSRKVSTTGGKTWDNVFRSEVIENNLNPIWEEAVVELSTLCGGNLTSPIDITLFDHERSGKHVIMGQLETNVESLLEMGKSGASRPMLLKKNGKDTGTIIVMKAEIHGASPTPAEMSAQTQYAVPTAQMATASINSAPRAQIAVPAVPAGVATASAFVPSISAPTNPDFVPPTNPDFVPPPAVSPAYRPASTSKDLFVDYVSGGCELHVVVAIDFTGSNGDPRQPGTLHHIDPNSRNQYEQAIAAIVSILLQYDSDKKIPVLGFGAKYGGVVRHVFQCGPNPEAEGLQGVLEAYHSVFRSGLIMSRPTVFNEVLEAAAKAAQEAQNQAQQQGGQAYTILLILSDGAVSDVNATATCLKNISDNPLSVVIVGVGTADFTAMQFLDDYAASTGSRDIAQFVEFNQHAHSSQSLTKATLEEIPEQLVAYFQSKNIPPLPTMNRTHESMENLALEEEEEIDLSLDITEGEITVTGGGDSFVNGFNAK